MPEAVCENCGTAYPYHVKRGCSGRHILPPTEPQKEAVKPEVNIEEIAYRWRCIMVGWNWDDSLDGEHFDQIEKALKGALTEYAESLKER